MEYVCVFDGLMDIQIERPGEEHRNGLHIENDFVLSYKNGSQPPSFYKDHKTGSWESQGLV